MATKPGDNKLGRRDTITLAAYRDRIDPEARGVSWADWAYHAKRSPCLVCGDPCTAYGREFALKGILYTVEVRGICVNCHQEAQGAHKAAHPVAGSREKYPTRR